MSALDRPTIADVDEAAAAAGVPDAFEEALRMVAPAPTSRPRLGLFSTFDDPAARERARAHAAFRRRRAQRRRQGWQAAYFVLGGLSVGVGLQLGGAMLAPIVAFWMGGAR